MEVPVSTYLNKRAPYQESRLQSREPYPNLIKLEMTETDTDLLIRDTLAAVANTGIWGYRLKGKNLDGSDKKDDGYLGMGLTYNPLHTDGIDTDPHEQVQGNHFKSIKESFGTTEFGNQNPYSRPDPTKDAIYSRKNTHYDTYSMAFRTPGSRYGYLGTFLDSIKRSLVRSSIRIISSEAEGQPMGPLGQETSVKRAGTAWHVDETMFENLRINIAIDTHPIFVLEQKSEEGVLKHLEAPYAYSWDTGIPHRAYASIRTEQPIRRTHIMLGIAPWWDFNETTQVWTQNEFFGVKHPWDMLVDGDIISGARLIK
jgi:hypothetical protein